MIKRFASLIDPKIAKRSGKVFYSGRSAFGKKSDLYLIGFNPGGDLAKQRKETVKSHTADVLSKFSPRWSAYSDESWAGNRS